MNLNVLVKLTSEGKIDTEATMDLCRAELTKLSAEHEANDWNIFVTVEAIFDAHPGVRMNMDFIINEALRRINVQPDNYKVWQNRVHKFLQANCQGDKKEDGTHERPTSKYVMVRGKGGGVSRRA
jgi:hypothetical protein